jgi:hypothetical protein
MTASASSSGPSRYTELEGNTLANFSAEIAFSRLTARNASTKILAMFGCTKLKNTLKGTQ